MFVASIVLAVLAQAESGLSGVVRDARGQPVAGAVVSQSGDGPTRTQATTDGQGRFRLDGIARRPAFVFAKKAGFRFHGQVVGEGAEPIAMTLTRADEKPAPLRTRPPATPHAEELTLARRAIDAYAEKVLKEGQLNEKVWALQALAGVEPDRVLAEAEKGKYPDPFYSEMFRMRVAEGMAHDDPDAAAEIAESMQNTMARSQAYIIISTRLDPTPANRAKRLALLDQGLVQARAVKEGDKRLACLAMIADQWLELGETEKATRLLRETEKDARELPNAAFAGYIRGVFAEELAQIDLEAALGLTRDLKDKYEYDRHHGNIAHELAARDPAAAERVLGMMRDQRQRDYAAIRVAYRMAPVDRPRARRIADGIQHTLMKPYALGMMAQALAGADATRPDAAALLAAAFDEQARSVEAGSDAFNNMEGAAVTAASLLPVAEAIDPTLVPEYLWRSISLRRPTAAPGNNAGQATFLDQANATLAMRLARYDPAPARILLDPIIDRVLADPEITGASVCREAIVALGLVNPRKAVAVLDRLPEGTPRSLLRQTRDRARRELATVLARTGDRRWKHLTWEYFHTWVPDVEDIMPPF